MNDDACVCVYACVRMCACVCACVRIIIIISFHHHHHRHRHRHRHCYYRRRRVVVVVVVVVFLAAGFLAAGFLAPTAFLGLVSSSSFLVLVNLISMALSYLPSLAARRTRVYTTYHIVQASNHLHVSNLHEEITESG